MRNGAEQALTDGPGIGQEYCWILAELQDVNLAGKKVVTRVQTPSFPKRRDGFFCASREESAVLARAFDERRDSETGVEPARAERKENRK